MHIIEDAPYNLIHIIEDPPYNLTPFPCSPDRDLEGNDNTKYTAQASGCGACNAGEKTAGGCLECDSELCNGSPVITVSFLLAAASAFVYLM